MSDKMREFLPGITEEDRQLLHYNPNTDDLVEWVQEYAMKAVQSAKSAAVPVEVMDSRCTYAAFAGRVCNKCGRIHDGKSDAVPVVGEVVGWLDTSGGGLLTGTKSEIMADALAAGVVRSIHEDILVPLVIQPATSITAAELDALRKDAAKALHAEQIRITAVAAIREVTGCPDIKGKDGAYLVDSLIVNLIEMQNDAAIAGETK